MTGFLVMMLFSVLVIATNSMITYEILGFTWGSLPRLTISQHLRVLLIIIPIFLAHIVSIWVYAAAYFFIENFSNFGDLIGSVSPAEFSFNSFIERLYFSASTYSSLGFGDVVPTNGLRMLASAEVLNGLVMIGWTVSFTYLAMEEFWSNT